MRLDYNFSLGKSNRIFKALHPYVRFFGDYSVEATLDSIPNSTVKLYSADGTARVTGWESRTSPKLNSLNSLPMQAIFLLQFYFYMN